MKQLKFLMIVFALMMGVSFTSCMGESDPTVSPVATLKVVSTYPYTFQYPNDGLKIVASNTSELLTDNSVNLGLGDIIFLQYTYNSEEQPLTSETKEITAKVTIGHNCTSGNTSIGVPVENNGAGEPYENATIVELLPAGQGTMYYDKNTLLLGVTFSSVFCLFPEQEANKVAPIPNTIVDFMIIIYLYRFMHHKHCPLSQIRIDILFGLWDRPFIVLLLTESTAVYPPSAIFVRFTTRLHTYAL